MNPRPARIAECDGEEVENINIEGDKYECVNVIMYPVFDPSGTVRGNPAFIGVVRSFAFCSGRDQMGNYDGKEGKKDCYKTEKGNWGEFF